jgi:hypothetical protein
VSLTNPVGGKRSCLVLLPRECYRFLFQLLPPEWPVIFREGGDDSEMPGQAEIRRTQQPCQRFALLFQSENSPISISGAGLKRGKFAYTPRMSRYNRTVHLVYMTFLWLATEILRGRSEDIAALDAYFRRSREDPGAGQAWGGMGWFRESPDVAATRLRRGGTAATCGSHRSGMRSSGRDTPDSARSNHTHLVMEKAVR